MAASARLTDDRKTFALPLWCNRLRHLLRPLPRWHARTGAAALMCSRYSAYALKLGAYLLATWHPGTRPVALDLAMVN